MLPWTWVYNSRLETQISTLESIHSKVGSLDHMVIVFNFWGDTILFSKVPVSFYSPINSAQGFQFLPIFANTCDFLVVFFFLGLVIWSIFSFALCHVNIFSGEMSVWFHCPLLNRVDCFSCKSEVGLCVLSQEYPVSKLLSGEGMR